MRLWIFISSFCAIMHRVVVLDLFSLSRFPEHLASGGWFSLLSHAIPFFIEHWH